MNTANHSQHVGSVDVLKFLLVIVITMLHCGNNFGDASSPFRMGGIAVEAFFVISGCLMCMTAEREGACSGRSLGEETLRFLGKKVRPLLVPYLVMLIIYLICWWISDGFKMLMNRGRKAVLLKLFSYLPNAAFLSMSGILSDTKLMKVTWYISAMLIAMLIIYPLLRRFGSTYRLITAPAAALLLMGYMYHASDGTYKGIYVYQDFMIQGLMRAFIALNLGCCAYEISERLKKAKLTQLSYVLLTAGVIFLVLTAVFVMQYGNEKACYTLTLLYPILIGILFSGQIIGNRCFNHRICFFLGKAGMYMYLYHICISKILLTLQIPVTYVQAAILMLTGAFAMFVITDLLETWVRHLLHKHDIQIRSLFILSESSEAS